MHRRIATPSTAVLLLRTPLRTCIAPCLWVCDWCELKGAGRSRKQIWWYDDTSFKFNSSTTIAIYLGQRVHEHLLAGIHGGGRGFQWSFDSLTARATEKMRLLQLWVNIWFISILHPGEKETNSSVCETLSMRDRSWCDTIKSGFTHTSYHAAFVCDVNVCKILLLALLSDFDWSRCVRKHSNAQEWKM